MVDETPNSGFTKAGQPLHEVEPFADGGVWVVVNTFFGSTLAKHIGQKGGVTSLLVGHEFDERHILGIETGLFKFGL